MDRRSDRNPNKVARMNILKYSDYHGKRFAWKIGDLSGDDGYDPGSGQFSATLDFNINSETFKNYQRDPWKVLDTYLDHSLSVVFWRWGIWVAIRGRKI